MPKKYVIAHCKFGDNISMEDITRMAGGWRWLLFMRRWPQTYPEVRADIIEFLKLPEWSEKLRQLRAKRKAAGPVKSHAELERALEYGWH